MTILVNDLPAIDVQNLPEWKQKELAAVEQIRKDFAPFYELEVCADGENDNLRYFFARFKEFPHIQVKRDRNGQYDITDFTRFNTDQKFEGKEPNNFKVVSYKKITDWLEYYAERASYLNEVVRLKNEKIAAFTAEFEKAGGKLEMRGNGVQSGQLIKNGIKYTVVIQQPSGYIKQTVELHYKVPNRLSAFLALSENKYLPV